MPPTLRLTSWETVPATPQEPLCWLATQTWEMSPICSNEPAAEQLPADTQETTARVASLATLPAGARSPRVPGSGSAASQSREGSWSSRKPTSRPEPAGTYPPMEHRCGPGQDSASDPGSSVPVPGTAVAPPQTLPDSATTNGCVAPPDWKKPVAPQSPAAAQETAAIPAEPPVFSPAATEGSPWAAFQVPPASPTTNAWVSLVDPSV